MHISSAPSRGVWLPLVTHVGFNNHLKKHPYCEKCGTVKNIGGDKAKSIGYYTDVLIAIREHINNKRNLMPKLTQTQIRLIAKELESSELFMDTYGSNLDVQRDKFIEDVKKYRPDLIS
jgi:hypothetical protein